MLKRLAALLAATGLMLGSYGAIVDVDAECVGMGTVTWSEKGLGDGTVRLTLKATAASGHAFAGWSVAERDVVAWPDDLRHPGSLNATVVSNAQVAATFVPCADDGLSFELAGIFPEALPCGEAFSQVLDVDSVSFPTITFKNLPSGLSYDARTLTVSGTPKEPGLYRIEANAVNGSGFSFRAFCTVRVANVGSPRVTGVGADVALDEYFYSEIGHDDVSDVFIFDETPSSVSLSARVPGLTWNGSWQLLYGTPTEPGEYTLRATAHFPTGRVETATATLNVAGADPEDYDIDLSCLENLQVGDAIDADTEIGTNTSEVAIRGVTGLPTGISAASRFEDGAQRWFVSGTVRGPGFFDVTLRVEDRSDGTQRVVRVRRTVAVADVPDVYLAAVSADASRGTVSGGGVVSPLEDVTLKAKAKKGYVFAGWHDSDGERLDLADGVDYRQESVRLPAGSDFAFLAPVAHFVAKADDAAPDLEDLADSDFVFSPDDFFEEEFAVDSLSLPALTFKGLPTGVTCVAAGAGSFALVYDPASSTAKSGRYVVTATAVNRSGRKSSVTFRITVETCADTRINVEEDYGEFAPGEAIEPISLADAVDFARGETLSVSGLPKGLVYNPKANAKKGIAARTITGTPTKPGYATLTFSARVVAGASTNKSGKVTYRYEKTSATAFLTVLPYPELSIDVDEDAAAAGCRVVGAGNYKSGTKVTLKAQAAKGWVFAGWEGLDGVEDLLALKPQRVLVTGRDDLPVEACFAPVYEDGLSVGAPDLTEEGFAAEWPVGESLGGWDASLVADLIETVSWPTVAVDGLPPGVKFSPTSLLLSGTPKKSGVYHVTVRVKNAGGYSFVRVFDVAVLNADGTFPSEKALANAAEIDFSPLTGLTTGLLCPAGAVVLAVGAKPGTGAAVGKVSVSGLPAGLAAATVRDGDGATVEVTGTPKGAGRAVVTFAVTYADGKTLKSQTAVVVQDGGSQYLFVAADETGGGTVSGEGVYAAGATVKLVAKAAKKYAFTGWCAEDDADGLSLFAPLRDVDGVDPRAPTVAFPFRPADFDDVFEMTGTFVSSAEDVAPAIVLEDDVWEIDPAAASSLSFAVDSLSVPQVAVSGLPKGVKVDAVRGTMSYAPAGATVPGVYAACISAKNATVSKAVSKTLEIRVANRVSDVIGGLDPDRSAYSLTVGTKIDPALIAPTADEGWTLAASGLPKGLSFKNGVVTGVPSKTGDFTVTFTATTGKGVSRRVETATITLHVSSLPKTLSGTFAGVLTDAGETVVGTVSVTATTVGKITLVAKTAANETTFSGKSWLCCSNGVVTVEMTAKGGGTCSLSIVATDDWQAWQATGVVTIGESPLTFAAQRNPYGAKDGDADAKAVVTAWAGTSKIEGWTVKLTGKGVATLAGKYGGKSFSGSTALQWDEEGAFARYVKFIDKKSVVCLVFRFDEEGRVCSWSDRN